MKKLYQPLSITQVKTETLNPALYNPRKWGKQAEKKLTESIKRFGFVNPIIVNGATKRKNIIIGGHFRYQIALKLGFKEIPVVYVNIPIVKKEKELNLRLNRNTGEWDFELLKKFDIGQLLDIGFDDFDLSNIWNDILETEEDGFNTVKELNKIKKPKTKAGDLFQLGPHRLICGDATDSQIVKKLVRRKEINMIYCDPPYNIKLNYNKGIGTKGKYGGTKTKDNKKDGQYSKFLKKTIENALNVAKRDCHVFYWCDENYVWLLQTIYKQLGISNKRTCLWIKNNQNRTPQNAFDKVYEPCVYGIKGKPYLSPRNTHLNEILNKEITCGNRLIDDVLDLFNIWLVKKLPTIEYEHPTEKPPTLHEKALRRCTKPNDIVLDLFAGSGSTLIACEQLKRICFLAEIDPIFCDLTIKRYEQFTGQKAKKIN